jgi:transcriptional regulator with PAS, ATPase and Fis domain
MLEVYDLIRRVAPREVTVLITGESGTGKELVARTIHEHSPRAGHPFLAINCGAMSPQLVESELFGHERGSFTGAAARHRGHFERASGGTLFLDEITEVRLELQAKLLRVLETGTALRVGGDEPVQTDVRIIAATNRPPVQAVRDQRLREDLYYRLNVFPIALPPLRERPGDVRLLAHYFLDMLNEQRQPPKRIGREMLARLERYDWPGNVRQLRNVIHRAYILAEDRRELRWGERKLNDPDVPQSLDAAFRVGETLETLRRRVILATLAHYRTRRRTAAVLGISLKTLYNRLQLYEREGDGG